MLPPFFLTVLNRGIIVPPCSNIRAASIRGCIPRCESHESFRADLWESFAARGFWEVCS